MTADGRNRAKGRQQGENVVTMKGLSTWQRAEAIISVAHPQFRDELIADAEKMHIWRRSNKN